MISIANTSTINTFDIFRQLIRANVHFALLLACLPPLFRRRTILRSFAARFPSSSTVATSCRFRPASIRSSFTRWLEGRSFTLAGRRPPLVVAAVAVGPCPHSQHNPIPPRCLLPTTVDRPPRSPRSLRRVERLQVAVASDVASGRRQH